MVVDSLLCKESKKVFHAEIAKWLLIHLLRHLPLRETQSHRLDRQPESLQSPLATQGLLHQNLMLDPLRQK